MSALDRIWLIEVCSYCGEQIENPPNKFLRGHTHYGRPDVHGHDLPVYISPQIVEVVPRRGFRDLLSSCKQWRQATESRLRLTGPRGEVIPLAPDQALFDAIDKAEAKP